MNLRGRLLLTKDSLQVFDTVLFMSGFLFLFGVLASSLHLKWRGFGL